MTTDKRLSSVLILRAKGEGRLCFLTLRCPHGNLKISFASHCWAIKTTQEMFACCNPRLKKNRHTYTRLWNVYFRGLLLLQNQLCYLARHDLSPQGWEMGCLRVVPCKVTPIWKSRAIKEVRQLQGWYLSAVVPELSGIPHWAMPQFHCHTENKPAMMWSEPREKQVKGTRVNLLYALGRVNDSGRSGSFKSHKARVTAQR